MLKSLIAALALGALAVTGIVGQAQAHHKTGHCIRGIVTAGCPIVPSGPQPGK